MNNQQQQAISEVQPPWENTFRNRLAKLREERGYTQTDLARELRDRFGLRFHQQTVQKVEAGERPVRLNEAHLIALALGVELESMTRDDPSPDYVSLRLEVDRIRSGAQRSAFLVSRTMDEFVVGRASRFADQMAHQFLGSSTVEHGDVSEVVEWGIAWAAKIVTAYDWIAAASDSLRALAYGDNAKTDTGTVSLHQTAQATVGRLRTMVAEYERHGFDLEELVGRNPDELYVELIPVDTGLSGEYPPERGVDGES